MVARLFQCSLKPVAFMLLLLFGGIAEAAELQLLLDKTEAEMGKFIIARIVYRGPGDPGPVDLTLWKDDFFIDQFDAELSTSEDGLIETETRARLYPRHSGDITLDSIALGGSFIRPRHVSVAPSIRNSIDATPQLQPLKDFYWADEAIRIDIRVPLHDKRNSVLAEDFELDGFSVQTLKPQRITTPAGSHIILSWVLLTPHKGHYQIELPAIQQRGRGRFLFHLPLLNLTIRPLPAYLPPTVPVGRPSVSSKLIESSDRHLSWQIQVKNPGRLPDQLEGFSRLLEAIHVDESELTSETKTEQGISSRQYQVPLPEWFFARNSTLKLAFFNTDTGRLDYLQHKLPSRWHAPRYAIWSGILLATLLMFVLANRLDRLATLIRRSYGYRQRIRHSITAHQLRKLLLELSGAKTLSDWAAQNRAQLPTQITNELNCLCFSAASSVELDNLKTNCLRYLSLRRVFIQFHRAPG